MANTNLNIVIFTDIRASCSKGPFHQRGSSKGHKSKLIVFIIHHSDFPWQNYLSVLKRNPSLLPTNHHYVFMPILKHLSRSLPKNSMLIPPHQDFITSLAAPDTRKYRVAIGARRRTIYFFVGPQESCEGGSDTRHLSSSLRRRSLSISSI